MKKPIILNTNFNFVVVGPLLSKDGIIVCDNEQSIDLIGAAHRIYKNDKFHDLNDKKNSIQESITQDKEKISYFWSDNFSFNSRKEKLLFVIKAQSYKSSNLDSKTKLINKFNGFLLESSLDLDLFMLKKSTKETRTTEYDDLRAAILWEMAEFLELCPTIFFIPKN